MRLDAREIETAYWCLLSMIRFRRHDVPRPVSDLFDRLDNAFHQKMSPPGQESGGGSGDPGKSSWIGSAEVAELLGISARTVRRNYKTYGGEMVRGTLIFDRDTVLECGRDDA